jgi:hypothetical protein
MRIAAPTAVAVALLAGCAVGVAPGQPKDVRGKGLPAHELHEECFAMASGDELRWRFSADAPLDFGVYYRDGKVVVMPVTRERVTVGEGRFVALSAHDYCASWESGAQALTLNYSLELGRPRR